MYQEWSLESRAQFFFSRIMEEGTLTANPQALALSLTVFELVNDSVELLAYARGIKLDGPTRRSNWHELATPTAVATAEQVLSYVRPKLGNGQSTVEWLTDMRTLYLKLAPTESTFTYA